MSKVTQEEGPQGEGWNFHPFFTLFQPLHAAPVRRDPAGMRHIQPSLRCVLGIPALSNSPRKKALLSAWLGKCQRWVFLMEVNSIRDRAKGYEVCEKDLCSSSSSACCQD